MIKLIALATLIALPATAASAADVAHGAVVFKQCAVCHNFKAGGTNKIGPNLWGVVGRKSATYPGFTYSAAMKAANKVWTPAVLDTYLTAPAKMVPGTKMTFAGLKNPADRADVIAYLQTGK
jgi:cytochrome c